MCNRAARNDAAARAEPPKHSDTRLHAHGKRGFAALLVGDCRPLAREIWGMARECSRRGGGALHSWWTHCRAWQAPARAGACILTRSPACPSLFRPIIGPARSPARLPTLSMQDVKDLSLCLAFDYADHDM